MLVNDTELEAWKAATEFGSNQPTTAAASKLRDARVLMMKDERSRVVGVGRVGVSPSMAATVT